MEKEKKKRFECYVNYEELQAFYRAQGEISLIFHVSRAVFPSSLLYRDRKIILRSEFQLFEFSFSKGEGRERVRGPQTRAPPLRRALSTTFSPARCLKIFFPSAKIPEDGTKPNVKFLRISTGSRLFLKTIFAAIEEKSRVLDDGVSISPEEEFSWTRAGTIGALFSRENR